MGMFDDLIPEKPNPRSVPPEAAKPAGMFDDLIPKREPRTMAVLPFRRDEKGEWSFAVPRALTAAPGFIKEAAQSAWSGATLPGDVYRGEAPDLKSPEGFKRVMDLAPMAVGAGPGVNAGLAKSTRAPAAAPSTQALKDAGGKSFDAARGTDAVYSGDAIRGMAQALRVQLENKGIMPEAAPAAFAALKKLEAAPVGSTTDYARIKAMRDMFNNASASNVVNKVEGKAGKEAVKMIDDFLSAPPPGAAQGGWKDAAKLHQEALGNYAAGMRSETLEKTLGKAERQAAGANSGMNLDNNLRQKVRSILEDPKKVAGFNKTERAAMEAFIEGTAGRNTLRRIGNMFGGGGGMGSFVSGGAASYAGTQVFGPAGSAAFFVPTVVASAMKNKQNDMARNSLLQIMEEVRRRAPAYQTGGIGGRAPVQGAPRSFIGPRGLLGGLDEDQP